MNTLQTVLVSVVASAVVVALGFALVRPAEITKVVENLGTASSPALVNGCEDKNGLTSCFYTQAMKEASTTCAFKSPTSTSTLEYAVATVRTANVNGAFDLEWGKANTAFATTTTLGYGGVLVTDGNQVTLIASTTAIDLSDPARVIAPNQWVNLKVGSSTPDNLTGECAVLFRTF